MTDDLARPAHLLAEIRSWVAALADRGLATAPALASIQDVLAHSQGERLDAPDDPLLLVMLCGPTAVGKSSLINALAGSEISRAGLGASTAAAVIYAHERDDPARFFEYSETLGQLGREAVSLVRHDRDELLHKVLIDTPDIDSVLSRHCEITGALVHCADLVLFVTSPEKYKVMHSAHWVAEQRGQRAIAFVLNKWDRFSFGPQYDHRSRVERDFRDLLAAEGFADPLVFKVSTRADAQEADSELAEIRAFIEEGLDRSAAVSIQDRRRRAAWGRLGAAIAPIVPEPFSDHPFVAEAADRLAATQALALRTLRAEALSMMSQDLDRSVRPTTPGLLGSWIALTDRVGAAVATVRNFIGRGETQDGAGWHRSKASTSLAPERFGSSAAALLAATTQRLVLRNDETARLPLGPVRGQWAAAASELGERLGEAPLAVEADLITSALLPSPRRTAGLAALVTIELLIAAVLLVAVWRLGAGFVSGEYVAGALFGDGVALVVVLLLIGQILIRLLFPTLREKQRKTLIKRADGLVNSAWAHARAAIDAQVESAERLAREGCGLLIGVDDIVRSLSIPEGVGADRMQQLFGMSKSEALTLTTMTDVAETKSETTRKPPIFD